MREATPPSLRIRFAENMKRNFQAPRCLELCVPLPLLFTPGPQEPGQGSGCAVPPKHLSFPGLRALGGAILFSRKVTPCHPPASPDFTGNPSLFREPAGKYLLQRSPPDPFKMRLGLHHMGSELHFSFRLQRYIDDHVSKVCPPTSPCAPGGWDLFGLPQCPQGLAHRRRSLSTCSVKQSH